MSKSEPIKHNRLGRRVANTLKRARERLRREPVGPTPGEAARAEAASSIDTLYERFDSIHARYLPDREAYARQLTALQQTHVAPPGTTPPAPPRVAALEPTPEEDALLAALAGEIGTEPEALRRSLHGRMQLRALRDHYLGQHSPDTPLDTVFTDILARPIGLPTNVRLGSARQPVAEVTDLPTDDQPCTDKED